MRRNQAPPYDVNGRTVFITGAARGIGAETARRLHAKGANVALVGLEPERLEAAGRRARRPRDRDRGRRVRLRRFGACRGARRSSASEAST